MATDAPLCFHAEQTFRVAASVRSVGSAWDERQLKLSVSPSIPSVP